MNWGQASPGYAGEDENSPDKAGTDQNRQMAWVRQARWREAREEPAIRLSPSPAPTPCRYGHRRRHTGRRNGTHHRPDRGRTVRHPVRDRAAPTAPTHEPQGSRGRCTAEPGSPCSATAFSSGDHCTAPPPLTAQSQTFYSPGLSVRTGRESFEQASELKCAAYRSGAATLRLRVAAPRLLCFFGLFCAPRFQARGAPRTGTSARNCGLRRTAGASASPRSTSSSTTCSRTLPPARSGHRDWQRPEQPSPEKAGFTREGVMCAARFRDGQ